MKARTFLLFLGVIFITMLACEDVIQLTDENYDSSKSKNDSIYTPPGDSTDNPSGPDSTGTDNPIPGDSTITAGPNSPYCDSVADLWICGMDDASLLNYELLVGTWRLRAEYYRPAYPGEHTDTYYGDDSEYFLTINSDKTFREVSGQLIVSEGSWQTYPEMNNQIWLTDSEGNVTKYYLLGLSNQVDYNMLRIATLDKEKVAIIDREFRR